MTVFNLADFNFSGGLNMLTFMDIILGMEQNSRVDHFQCLQDQ